MPAEAGVYTFAGQSDGQGGNIRVDTITHVKGYTGANGGTIVQTVGIDPGSPNRGVMPTAVRNVVRTLNNLIATRENLLSGGASDLGSNQYDFESVLLHEMGHALGLGHVNLASESGLSASFQDFTKSTTGANGTYFLNAGGDGTPGSADDLRDDDLMLYWYNLVSNDPVGTLPERVDTSTFSRDVTKLPNGNTYCANSDRDVTSALGYPDTEGVMQQGSLRDEAQRTLTTEAVASLRMAMAGLDRTEGTSDDYTIELLYVGTASADIVIDFDSTETVFAETRLAADFIGGTNNHLSLLNVPGVGHIPIFFNNTFNWYFNQTSNEPDPASLFVDFSAVDNGDGFELTPFDNLGDALANAASGGTANLRPGASSETFTGVARIDQVVQLTNTNPGLGTVRIGQQSQP